MSGSDGAARANGVAKVGVSSRKVAFLVAAAFFMDQLDTTILATAIPRISAEFGISPVRGNAAITAYLLGVAFFIPVSGALAERWGARTVFQAAILVFSIASVLCALAPSFEILVLGRLLQGAGGAMMVPVGRLILLRSVPKSDYVRAMSWVLIPAMIGPVLGPLVGGAIVTFLDWRWIFIVNVPIGAVGLVLASLFVGDIRGERKQRFDVVGWLLAGSSLTLLIGGMELLHAPEVERAWALACIVGGGVLVALYAVHARRIPRPVLDLKLMEVRTFAISLVAGTLFRLGIGAMPFLLPLMFQIGFGMSPMEAGLLTVVSAIGGLAMKFVTVPILRLYGFRNALVWNGAICAGFLAACAFMRPEWPVLVIVALLAVGGLGRSLQMNAYGTLAYADVPDPQMSGATAFYSVFQQFSVTAGVSLAALTLALSVAATGADEPSFVEFGTTFLVLAIVAAFAVPVCAKLSMDDGRQVSGHSGS